MIVSYFERLYNEKDDEEIEPDEQSQKSSRSSTDGSLDFSTKLRIIVENSKKTADVQTNPNSVLKVVKTELAVFNKTKLLGEKLKLLRSRLEVMKPSSIASERTFSIAGNFKTCLRSRLADETLDKLTYLKFKFINGELH